jgi:hypothetical protein
LAEVVIVVLIVIFARIVVEANGHLQRSMLVLPASIPADFRRAAHDRAWQQRGNER